MENFKSILISIIVLAGLGLGIYWSFTTLQTGTEYVADQKIKQLQKDNEDLKKEVANLSDQFNTIQPKIEDLATAKEEIKQEEQKPATPTTPTVYKNQSLIDELQDLIKHNVFMKSGSTGSRVGTVQRFLNIYNKTSNTVDNDYGPTTKKHVVTFQKNVGISADGEAGIGTFGKMIDWLKKQG